MHYKFKLKKMVIIMLGILATNSACSETERQIRLLSSESKPMESYVEPAENAIVLSSTALRAITSLKDDGTVVFSEMPSELADAEIGDILVISACDAIPSGALLKIDSLFAQAKEVMVKTSTAKLDEAIVNSKMSVEHAVFARDIRRFSALQQGVALRENNAAQTDRALWSGVKSDLWSIDLGDIVIDLNGTVLVDADSDTATTYDQIRVDGEITISPEFEFDLAIENFKVTEFLFKNNTSEVANLTITNGDITRPAVEFGEEMQIAVFTFSPIVFSIGSFPVVITPILSVSIGVDGSVSYEISTGLHQTADMELGFHYQDNKWTPISEVSLGFGISNPSISAACQVRGYVAPEFSLLLYGVVGPYVDVEGFLKLSVDGQATVVDELIAQYSDMAFTTDVPNGTFEGFLHWQLTGGIVSHAGIQLSLLSTSSLDWDFEIFRWEKSIHEGLLSGYLVYDENGIVETDYTVELNTAGL